MFAITGDNNPRHSSFCTTAWVLADFKSDKEYFLGPIGIIAAHEILKAWYERLGFVEKETRTFAHLPFDVKYMHYRI
jgi:hypothetical protein